MSRRYELTDEQWNRIEKLLPGRPGYPGGQSQDNRLFVNAVILVARTGAPRRDQPARFGLSNSVFQRFNRWAKSCVWERVFRELHDPDLAALMLDSTVIRAHQHAAGAPPKESREEALGRSRGGFSSKLHLAVDAQGQAVELCLGPGEEHDVTRAEALLSENQPKAVIADKGYDADELVQRIGQRGAQVEIPPRSNRNRPRKFNKRRYKSRNLVERFVNPIKHYRPVATR
jgi:transposase